MTRSSITIVAATCMALTIGCGEGAPPIEPTIGGETHWLESCESDSECGTSYACLCGVCTLTCFENSDLCEGQPTPASCVEMSAVDACDGAAASTDAWVCLGECESDRDCASGEVCDAGLCVADEAAVPDRWIVFDPDTVAFDPTPADSASEEQVTVLNIGPEPVQIIGLATTGSDAFEMGIDATNLPITILPGKTYPIVIRYEPTTSRPARGSIQLETTAPDGKTGVTLHAPGVCGTLISDLRTIDFGDVSWGDSPERLVQFVNDGATTLHIEDIRLDNPAFSFDEPVGDRVLLPNETLRVRVHYGPDAGPQEGSLSVAYTSERQDDVSACDEVEPLEVPLSANGAAPCIATSYPGGLNLGAVRLGDRVEESVVVLNCAPLGSGAPLEVTSAVLERSDQMGGRPFEVIPPPSGAPLAPGEHAEYRVRFEPDTPGLHQAALRFESTAFDNPTVSVDIEGLAEADACESLVTCTVGGSSRPLESGDVVALGERVVCTSNADGTEQIAEIAWRWQRTPFAAPEMRARDNGFEMSAALFAPGVYAMSASAFGPGDDAACAPHELWFAVVPEEELVVLLTWDTPGDTDLGDAGPGAGADVDLVLRRPGGSWDEPADLVHFANPESDWATESAQDDPHLIVDDSDGRGPEVIVIPEPASGEYAIGARYFSASGYGSSFVTAHVFVDGELAHTTHSVRLDHDGDFADIARVQWPSGRVLNYRAP